MEAVFHGCFTIKVFLEISQKVTWKHLYQSVYLNKVADLRQIKIEAPTRVFYCEFFEILNPQPTLNANKTSNEGLFYVQFRLYSTGHSLSIGNFEKTSYVMFCSPLLALHILCHPVYLNVWYASSSSHESVYSGKLMFTRSVQ